jgi:hypothetical protein
MTVGSIGTAGGDTRRKLLQWLKSTMVVAAAPGPVEFIFLHFQWVSTCKNVAPRVLPVSASWVNEFFILFITVQLAC